MHWPVLVLAGLIEAFIPILVIRSEDYTHPAYLALLLTAVICSILGLRYAMSAISLSIAYTVWTAPGILGTTVIGALVLKETLEILQLCSLLLTVIAVVGLRVSSIKASE